MLFNITLVNVELFSRALLVQIYGTQGTVDNNFEVLDIYLLYFDQTIVYSVTGIDS